MENTVMFKSTNYPLVPFKTQLHADFVDEIYLAPIGQKWEYFPGCDIPEKGDVE